LGPAERGSHIGRLTTAGDERTIAFSEITSDTAHPVTNEFKSSGAHDYQKLADRSDVLTFDSTPLTDDFEVTGFIQAQIFLSCDCRDLDLWVRLMDVEPDGTSFNLMSPGLDVLRASLRDGARGRQLLEPGKIYELALNNLITSNMFLKGHRVRVQIFGSFAPNFSSNLQTGESEATHARARNARIRIYRGGDHASQIVLPVIE
jgi:putative CocE/NonD family hydrolase